MKILNIRTIPGPNVYSHQPVLVMKLDLEDLASRESYEIPGFIDRLLQVLPGCYEHYCGLGRRGGFVERLRGGTYFGHIVEHVALELTDAVGISTNRGKNG
jgi:cyanophycin synthetase